jgi:hypothetical protein
MVVAYGVAVVGMHHCAVAVIENRRTGRSKVRFMVEGSARIDRLHCGDVASEVMDRDRSRGTAFLNPGTV